MISLFLDVDGTLIDLAGSPEGVHVPPRLPVLLGELHARLGGALALASGRNIATLDWLLLPYAGPAIGVHGIEFREPGGAMHLRPVTPAMSPLSAALHKMVLNFPSAFIEDKGLSIAVHYHGDAAGLAAIEERSHAILQQVQPDWRCLRGHHVVELKPGGVDKGVGLDSMMRLAPFAGTIPVALGDDITDLDLFAAARRHGGMGISVGDRIYGKGDLHLGAPVAVLRLLERLVAAPSLDTVNEVMSRIDA